MYLWGLFYIVRLSFILKCMVEDHINCGVVHHFLFFKCGSCLGQKKIYVCLLSHVKKIYGRSALFFFFFLLSAKPEIVVPGSGIWSQYSIFEISGKPSFVLCRVTQFFYLLCSQFRQKASGWINKTLLLIKQQKWLSEFCVKIDRVASKN